MQFGDYRVEIVPDTEFRLDGGAMFGVVPRVLWERSCPPDDQNRIKLTCNCLFIDTGREKILVDTGMGEKWSETKAAMYGIAREKPFARSLFETTGSRPEDITIVVNTHLHFDHAGGNTVWSISPESAGIQSSTEGSTGGFKPVAQFPNARYLVSRSEYHHAQTPHERDRASYLSENWQPLVDSGQLELMPDSYEPVEGLLVEQAHGHSETMQTIRLTRGGETLFGFFDMVPTRHHLPVPWVMGYDLFPTGTIDFKRRVLPLAMEEGWICHFYHDVEMPLGRLAQADGRLTATPLVP